MNLCGFSPTVLRNTHAFSSFYIKVLPIFKDIHVAPTFSFLWDKQLQIPYLFLIFCSPDLGRSALVHICQCVCEE